MGLVSGTVTGAPAEGWDRMAIVKMTNLTTNVTYETTISTVDGSYSLQVPVGTYKVFVDYTGEGNFLDRWSGGGGSATGYAPKTVTTTPLSLGLVAFAGGTISGTLSGEAPLSAPAVTVQRVGQASTSTPRVTVDPGTGEYLVDRLDPGTYKLRFSGGPLSTDEWWQDQKTSSTATPILIEYYSALTGYDVQLAAASSISGTVYGPEGSELAMMVYLFNDGVEFDSQYAGAGEYRFGDLGPGTYTVRFGQGTRTFFQTEWWNGVRSQAQATPIVISTPREVTGVDATIDYAPSITGLIQFDNFEGGMSGYSGQDIVLLKEEPAGSGTFVEYETQESFSGGGFAFRYVEPGKYIVRAPSSTEWFLRTTYWPGVTSLSAAGKITISPTRTTDFDASFDMVGRSIDVVERIAGSDRFATGVEATQFGFPDSETPVPVVYIANGLNYPDALAAGPAAVHQGGALLMVTPSSIPDVVMDELERLDPEKIVIVGGTGSVSTGVQNTLKAEFGAGNVTRIAGADRYHTSRLIAEYAFEEEGAQTAFIATGSNFPDALAAGPAASSVDAPVILVYGASPELDEETADLLVDLGVQESYVLGSPAAVSQGIASDLVSEAGTDVTRLQGPDRFSTALAVVTEFFDESHYAFLATGTNFPDALGGGALAGALNAPLYLTPKECLLYPVFYDLFYIDVHELYLLGGPTTLSPDIETPLICG